MKNYLIAICSVIVIVGFIWFTGQKQSSPALAGSTGGMDMMISNTSSAATTTLQYLLTSTATSTLIANIAGADQASIQGCATASTSASILSYSLWFTMQTTAVAPTWFQESSPTVGGSAATVLPITRSITLATTTTNYMCFDDLVAPVGAKRMMVKYSVSGSNAGVYMQIVSKVSY